MFVKSIELCGYKRLLPSDIKYLKVDFKNIQQVLLGVNGSGKSSLLVELNPMPATPADYLKGGYKYVEIEHNNQLYKLLSLIDTNSHHSFLLNGIELNEGGTGQVQKMLVKEHFNLDESLIEVLTDQSRFHLFSPLERRNWLTRLSGTNMDYALGFFKYIKTMLRDTDAVVKHIDARLAKESGDIISNSDFESLQADATTLEQSVMELLENKSITNYTSQSVLNELDSLKTDVLALASSVRAASFKPPVRGLKARSELLDVFNEVNDDLNRMMHEKTILSKEYGKVEDALNVLSSIENIDINTLMQNYDIAVAQSKEIRSNIRHYLEVNNPVALLGATDAIRNTFMSMVSELRDNSDGYFDRDKVDAAKKQSEDYSLKINALGVKLDQVTVSLAKFTLVEHVECPGCHMHFKPGVDPELITRLTEKKTELEADIESLKQSQSKINDYLSEAMAYTNEYRRLINVMQEAPNLKPLWDNIRAVDLKHMHPYKLIDVFNDWDRDIQQHVQYNKLMVDIANMEGALEKYRAVQDSQVGLSRNRLNELSNTLGRLQDDINDAFRLKEDLKQSLSDHDLIIALREKMIALMDKRNELENKYYHAYSQEKLNEMLSILTLKRSEIEQTLQSAKNARFTLNDLERQKVDAVTRRELLKALVKEMNPTDGLIAKQSKLFIEQFVEQINNIIASVWTYEMQVLPCPIESDKLTYKFPIYFSSTDASTADIAKSSAAQKGIIDFAFKLVVMAYLGLHDYPLYLDELAQNFDEKHRSNIMDFVKNFVSGGECSQLFIISHFHSGHGIFTNAEVTILDDTNLLNLPDSYNKHVVISSKMQSYKE